MLPIPDHPRIRHLGFLDDQDKFDALAASDLLLMPSYYESLSMVALEAWALGKPVLVNGRCEVLRGQCVRSRAGLYYETQAEFVETLFAQFPRAALNAAFSANGREFFQRHYAWPVIEQKYLDILARVNEEDARDPRQRHGARARLVRQATQGLRPANDVLADLPFGAGAELKKQKIHQVWPRSAMAMPSATKCWAFSACCARRWLRIGHLHRNRRSAPRRSDRATIAT